ncbi:alpha-L-fucosidase [Novipirellula artificiosorum]|uniref:alpha-L-fucosidase n=1 Tax=Novipirellula artificiosorum TaxID=2528016 RepID=A0A5C6D666_9BACT|nr:alpha-L-fucosidase [Novipirellula artificiosorum]TWU32328.1 Alpha-L-fucosidase [Novipirellula artificiosorum]
MNRISLLFVTLTIMMQCVIAQAPYQATWESIARAPVPQWWGQGKFGIFIHWGPYSVAGYKYRNRGYAEAITSDLYKNPDNYLEFMTAKFGAAPPEFGYKDMVPLFKADKWDPAAWAKLFKESGARYVIPTGEHHDGFVLWDSDLTPWTATKKGPMRDLIGDLANAVRAEGLKFGVSYHRERHPNRFTSEFIVDAEPFEQVAEEIRRMPESESLYGPFQYSDEFIQDYVARWVEIQNQYRPDFMWIDDVPIFYRAADDPQVDKFQIAFRKMIAGYLNAGQKWGKEVYFNNKGKQANWPLGVGCREADNLQMETIGPRWQNPATLGTSYAYMATEEEGDLYKSSSELVWLLCDVVSKNGNLLLNIGPRADGTIPEGMQRRLRDMGAWLELNGEAIYGSSPWKVFGEHEGEIVEEEDVFYTKHAMRVHEREIRFTTKPGAIYVIDLQPNGSNVSLKTFAEFDETIESISLLGSERPVQWNLTSSGLVLTPPHGAALRHAAVYKVTYEESKNELIGNQ